MTEPTPEVKQSQPILAFPAAEAFESWLAGNHDTSTGLWLKIAKKGSGVPTVSYTEALDVALCWGWIDSQKGSYDDRFFLQRFTPRGPRSKWSQVNRDKVAALLAAGRMRPQGQAAIDAARGDGRWDAAYAPQSKATVPPDMQQALDANPAAADFFATLTAAQRYSFLYRVYDAKRPETRARRIADFVDRLSRGETL